MCDAHASRLHVSNTTLYTPETHRFGRFYIFTRSHHITTHYTTPHTTHHHHRTYSGVSIANLTKDCFGNAKHSSNDRASSDPNSGISHAEKLVSCIVLESSEVSCVAIISGSAASDERKLLVVMNPFIKINTTCCVVDNTTRGVIIM